MLASISAWSQSSAIAYPHVSVMTPEASALARYTDVPVSYYTGVPNISIPLYTICMDDFKLPVSLNYHSSGIRVDQEATWVGLGWSLCAEGRITRTAKGIDDFLEYGYDPNYPYYKKGYYEAPDVTNFQDLYENYVYDNGTGILAVGLRKVIDTEPDIFYYSLPGYSGKFILDRKRGAVLYDRSHNIKVEVLTSYGEIVFKITDPEGNQFFYDDKEHSRNYTSDKWLNQNYTLSNPKQDDDPEDFIQWVPTIRNEDGEMEYEATSCNPYRMSSSWCLTRIVTHTGHTVNFDYTKYTEKLPTQESTEVYNNGNTANQFFYKSKVVNEGLQLSCISWDYGYITFQTSAREDIKGDTKKLDCIKVCDNDDREIKSYLFSYSYFNDNYSGNDNYTHVFKRLKLLSLQEELSGEKYRFDYYEGGFPAKNSKNVDYWGMQNGRNYGKQYQIGVYMGDQKYNGVKKDAVFDKAVIGMLRQIKYPTGGYARFVYELNEIGYYYSSNTNNDAAADQEDNPDEPEPWNLSHGVMHINVCNNYVINEHPDLEAEESFTFTLTGRTQIELECHLENHDCYFRDPDYLYHNQPLGWLKRTSTPATTVITYECPCVYERGNGDLASGEGCEVDVIPHWYTLDPGTYEFKACRPPKDVSAEWRLTFDRQVPVRARALRKADRGGGLRIASIETNSGTRTFSYSSGKMLEEPTFFYLGNRAGDGSHNAKCIVQVSESRTPLSSFNNGNVVGYDWVEETVESDGVTSRTRYYYYNELEEKYEDSPEFAFSPVMVNYYNGLLQKVEYYGDDVLLKDEEYSYQTRTSNIIFAMVDFGGKYGTNEMITYSYNVEWPLMTTSVAREYDKGLVLEDTCYYAYNGRDLLSQKTHRIDRKSYAEHFRYPFDFTDNISQSMVRHNTIKQPVETFYSVGDQVYSGVKITHLDSTKYFMPAAVYRLETKTGVLETDRNGYYVKYVQYDRYGPYGTLLQMRDKGVVTSYIWGYGYQYPVAVVENAEYLNLLSLLGGDQEVNEFAATEDPSDESIRTFLGPLQTHGNLYKGNATLYTHRKQTGVTSRTAPDGVRTYYGYDGAGRLSLVRDAHGKTVKTYTYHYSQQ